MRAESAPRASRVAADDDGPMGPTRMLLGTRSPPSRAMPWRAGSSSRLCDLRVTAHAPVFGVFCRHWGIPLTDGGPIRLGCLIGHSDALDPILPGRGVSGAETLRMGLTNRLVEPGESLPAAAALAREPALTPPGGPVQRRARVLGRAFTVRQDSNLHPVTPEQALDLVTRTSDPSSAYQSVEERDLSEPLATPPRRPPCVGCRPCGTSRC
jgi:hypothetical protein